MYKFLIIFLVICSSVFGQDLHYQIKELETSILSHLPEKTAYYHVLKEVREKELVLNDESVWKIGLWYRSDMQDWKKGNRLKISYHSGYSNHIKFENVDLGGTTWGNLEKKPKDDLADFLASIISPKIDPEGKTKVILKSKAIFKGPPISWKIRDKIFVLNTDDEEQFFLWNLETNEIVKEWVIVADDEGLNLEEKLSKKVLGQKEAITAVSSAIFNYWAGLNDPNAPLGVFLFLGPTGVGKTELAKALTFELFKNPQFLIRFDMSHFNEPHSTSRLIGSPPGYMNHDEGGQLTNALRNKPRSIVLLDEIEKAHPVVHKLFLPAFDEGYICDAKNRKVLCDNAVFIMTSNLCANEIAEMFHAGMYPHEVLQTIEPYIMQALSPELYNRLTPVVFRPLTSELMISLVDKMLNEVIERLKIVKNITLTVDDDAKEYLATHGYHPSLGARPLKRLIQKKVVGTLAQDIVYKSIPDGSYITLHYDLIDDHWSTTWL